MRSRSGEAPTYPGRHLLRDFASCLSGAPALLARRSLCLWWLFVFSVTQNRRLRVPSPLATPSRFAHARARGHGHGHGHGYGDRETAEGSRRTRMPIESAPSRGRQRGSLQGLRHSREVPRTDQRDPGQEGRARVRRLPRQQRDGRGRARHAPLVAGPLGGPGRRAPRGRRGHPRDRASHLADPLLRGRLARAGGRRDGHGEPQPGRRQRLQALPRGRPPRRQPVGARPDPGQLRRRAACPSRGARERDARGPQRGLPRSRPQGRGRRDRPAQGRDRLRQRRGRPDGREVPRALAPDRGREALLRAGRDLPQPPREPDREREPGRPL